MRVKCTMHDLADGLIGGCTNCGSLQDGCEPDARNYLCETCGDYQVYGLEELCLMDQIEIVDVDDDDDEEGDDDDSSE